MIPLAPALFSVTVATVQRSLSLEPRSRASVSAVVPGEKGTTSRIGRLGYRDCAHARGETPTEAATTKTTIPAAAAARCCCGKDICHLLANASIAASKAAERGGCVQLASFSSFCAL